jgi:hypothetical protein
MQEIGLTPSHEYFVLKASDGIMRHSVTQGCITDGDAEMRDSNDE